MPMLGERVFCVHLSFNCLSMVHLSFNCLSMAQTVGRQFFDTRQEPQAAGSDWIDNSHIDCWLKCYNVLSGLFLHGWAMHQQCKMGNSNLWVWCWLMDCWFTMVHSSFHWFIRHSWCTRFEMMCSHSAPVVRGLVWVWDFSQLFILNLPIHDELKWMRRDLWVKPWSIVVVGNAMCKCWLTFLQMSAQMMNDSQTIMTHTSQTRFTDNDAHITNKNHSQFSPEFKSMVQILGIDIQHNFPGHLLHDLRS